MSHEETMGLINGLVAVSKKQNAYIKDLSDLINLKPQASSGHAALRLPNLTLPEYTEIEYLDCFLDKFNQVL